MKRVWSKLVAVNFIMTATLFTNQVYSQDSKSADSGKQETAKSDEKPGSDKNGKVYGTYLDVAHAREDAIAYDEIIRDNIYKLQVVVANFGEANEKTALDAIVKEHIRGKKELFKRQYLSASTIMKKVRKDIRDLLNAITTRYQTKANDILGICAETLVDREIGIGSRGDMNLESAGRASKKLTQNRIKLVIAYDQLNMGDTFKSDERLSDAVTHYRLAKMHGINILLDLADSDNDKANVKNQYKVDIMDGDNLVSK